MKNSILYQIYARYEKSVKKKNCLFQSDLQIYCCFFTGVISFHLFIKNVSIKIKNSIFSPKYTKHRKSVKIQNRIFENDLQIFFFNSNVTPMDINLR